MPILESEVSGLYPIPETRCPFTRRVRHCPILAQVVVDCAGRTDRGVSAVGQVVSFHSWQDVPLERVAQCLNAAAPCVLRAVHVQRMPRKFHATFSVGPYTETDIFPHAGVVSIMGFLSVGASVLVQDPAEEVLHNKQCLTNNIIMCPGCLAAIHLPAAPSQCSSLRWTCIYAR